LLDKRDGIRHGRKAVFFVRKKKMTKKTNKEKKDTTSKAKTEEAFLNLSYFVSVISKYVKNNEVIVFNSLKEGKNDALEK